LTEKLKILTLQFTNFDFILTYKFSAFATSKQFSLRRWG